MDCFDGVQVDVEGLMKVDEVMTNDKKGEADGVASPLEEVKVVVGWWVAPPLEVMWIELMRMMMAWVGGGGGVQGRGEGGGWTAGTITLGGLLKSC